MANLTGAPDNSPSFSKWSVFKILEWRKREREREREADRQTESQRQKERDRDICTW